LGSKKDKLRGKDTRSPNPFDHTIHKTEMTVVSLLCGWMKEINHEKCLDFGIPEVETTSSDGKRPDAVIFETERSDKPVCIIEAKRPYFDVFDEDLKDKARNKANKRKSPYFCTTNFKTLIWWNTKKANDPSLAEEEQIVGKYFLSEMEDIDDIKAFEKSIRVGLEDFLVRLYQVYHGKETEPRLAIDEFLVFRLHEKIRVLSKYYRIVIEDKCHKDSSFAEKVKDWFSEQHWSFAWTSSDFYKLARQTAYLLVNKILFYNLLQAKRPGQLDILEISEHLTKAGLLKNTLQGYFEEVLKIDYETIYTTDFIDSVAFPESKEVVIEIKKLINVLKQYDFSKLGYDIVGRIFEQLIPEKERHNLGQYFTSADVVDLILSFCLKHEDDKILDPSCGAGTFLVRSYQHKKLLNQRKKHEDILESLWGVDIAKFPAHLAMINLAINDLSVDNNYPNIINEDFFNLMSSHRGGLELPESWQKVKAKTLGMKVRDIKYPRTFDAVVGNPPYTRSEEIGEITEEDDEYKEELIRRALHDADNKKLASIDKRAGIHIYFFVHGTKFLKNEGHFGFIVNNTWLDVGYGAGIQEFLLNNYKIVAIIESKVERWFAQADINTCIVILEKCTDKKSREKNTVRFVYLKKPLRHFIPLAQDMWEKQVNRRNEILKLKKTILAHGDIYENDELKVYPVKQLDLFNMGYNSEKKSYQGEKWGKYIRAPESYFKLYTDQRGGKFIKIVECADLARGFTTGADPWFYVKDITEETDREELKKILRKSRAKKDLSEFRYVKSGDGTKWLIEKEYVYPVIQNPADYPSISIDVDAIIDSVIVIDKDAREIENDLIESYVRHGETKTYKMGKGQEMVPSQTSTCSSRNTWFRLPSSARPSNIFWQKSFDRYLRHPFTKKKVYANQRYYPIYPKNKKDTELIAALINSSIIPLYLEVQRACLGQGALDATVEEVKQFPVVNPNVISVEKKKQIVKAFRKMKKRRIESIFDELGAYKPEDVQLDNVKPDRRELDKIIMGDVLGLSEEEQVEVYRSVVDLVKARLERASSVKKRKKYEKGVDVQMLKENILDKVKKESDIK